MPDFVSRKRLKKKVLDRWENEGGKLSPDLTSLPDEPASNQRKRKNKSQSQILQESSTASEPAGTRRRGR